MVAQALEPPAKAGLQGLLCTMGPSPAWPRSSFGLRERAWSPAGMDECGRLSVFFSPTQYLPLCFSWP